MSPLRSRRATQRAKDRAAFAARTEEHRGELEVHCLRLLGSREDAQDATQEALLRAWRSRDTFRGESSFRSWLYRIATNVCLDMRRRRAGQPPDHLVAGAEDAPDPPASAPEPDDELISKDLAEIAIMAAIRHLPPKQRGALVLHGVLGWSARDAGRLLDSSPVSVSSALQRARRTLTDRLPEQRLDWTPGPNPTEHERELARRYLQAIERADVDGFVDLLRREAARPRRP